MKRRFRVALLGAVAVACAGAANAAALYSNDFDGVPTIDAGATYGAGVSGSFSNLFLDGAFSGPWNGAGWSGSFAHNTTQGNPATTSVLSLSGLASHTMVNARFILGFLDSWDGNAAFNGVAPDNLEILVDGNVVAVMTANNAGGNEDFDGNLIVAHYQQVDGNAFFSDTLIDYGLTFAHTGSTLNLGIRASGAGWQGSIDESWGVDAVRLTYDGVADPGGGVPEPASWALMISGFGLAGGRLRRRRALAA